MKRFEHWKALLGLVGFFLAAGGGFATWESTVATVDSVDAVRSGATTALNAAQATTNTQLGALHTQVQDLRVRQAGIEAQLDVLTSMTQRMLDQTIEIAKATRAKQVKP